MSLHKGTVLKETYLYHLSNETKTLYLVPNEIKDYNYFIVAGNKTSICGEIAYETQSRELYVLENSVLNVEAVDKADPRNIDLNLMLSMKFDFLTHDMGSQIQKMFDNLIRMFDMFLTKKF